MFNRGILKIKYKRCCLLYKVNDMIYIKKKIIIFGKGDKIWFFR